MKNTQNTKGSLAKEKVRLANTLSEVEKFLTDFKIQNKPKWKSFEIGQHQAVSKAR